jgi:hypothetical protein
MKTILLLTTLFATLTASADSGHCKNLFRSHFERLELLSNLVTQGEISNEFHQRRLDDEAMIMEVSLPVMCKGLSAKKIEKIKAETLTELKQEI